MSTLESLRGALNAIADKEPGMCVFGDPPQLSADEANALLSQIFTIARVALAPRETGERDEDECQTCRGTGETADYVGLEMKCVGVECQDCKGTGRRARDV